MTVSPWFGIIGGLALVGFIAFAFRQGMRVRPDSSRKTEDWPRITLGGLGG